MVINNQKAPTVTGSQFLEQNITQDCDISLDPEMNLDCCEFVKGIQEWKYIYNLSGYTCGLFYKCDRNNFHCILNNRKIQAFCGLIIAIFAIVMGCAMCFKDLIRRKLNNLKSKLPQISGRRTEANSMEMN